MLKSIGNESGESVESVLKKKEGYYYYYQGRLRHINDGANAP